MKRIEIFNSTRDENGRFKTGYRASVGSKYVTIKFLSNRQGDRDKTWRVTLKQFDEIPGDLADKVLYVSEYCEPHWIGEPIR